MHFVVFLIHIANIIHDIKHLQVNLLFRLESLRRYARRRLGLDTVVPSRHVEFNGEEYAIPTLTTAQRSTKSSEARARAINLQKSKVWTHCKIKQLT